MSTLLLGTIFILRSIKYYYAFDTRNVKSYQPGTTTCAYFSRVINEARVHPCAQCRPCTFKVKTKQNPDALKTQSSKATGNTAEHHGDRGHVGTACGETNPTAYLDTSTNLVAFSSYSYLHRACDIFIISSSIKLCCS